MHTHSIIDFIKEIRFLKQQINVCYLLFILAQ